MNYEGVCMWEVGGGAGRNGRRRHFDFAVCRRSFVFFVTGNDSVIVQRRAKEGRKRRGDCIRHLSEIAYRLIDTCEYVQEEH